jgi:NAD(P)H-nitrite reductase large subunit
MPGRLRAIERALARHGRFRAALEQAFPFPAKLAQALPDDVMLCRCEAISVGALRAAVGTWGVTEMNRLKALTRIGMGRCQGRVCGTAAAEILAMRAGIEVEAVGRLRGQPPVKPIPLPWTDAT